MALPTKNAIEQIEQQMWKRAQELWGVTGPTSIEAFDPIVKMLIGAQAVEIVKIQNRIETAQKTMMSKLAELIMPDVITLPRPASTVLHIEPRGTDCIVDAEFQVSGSSEKGDIHFSPAGRFQLWDYSIEHCYLLLSNSLINLSEKTSFASLGKDAEIIKIGTHNNEQISKTRTLIIGMNLPEKIEQLQTIVFYFDFLYLASSDRYRYLRLLNSTRWFMCDSSLETYKGINTQKTWDRIQDHGLRNQIDANARMEDFILNLYKDHFVTVHIAGDVRSCIRLRPTIMDKLELSGNLDFSKPLLWLEVQFPAEYSDALLKDNLVLQVNCVPALNRKLHSLRYVLAGKSLNIVPVKTDDQFLTIADVRDSHGKSYQNVQNLPDKDETGGRYYLRRSDIARVDKRDISERLRETIELAKEEYSRFAALYSNDLLTDLHEIQKLLNKIEKSSSSQVKTEYPPWYMFIETIAKEQNHEELFIKYWSTMGKDGNGLPTGAITNVSSPSYRSYIDQVSNILPSAHGEDKPDEEGILNYYRNALLTHHRLVTREDIRAYCWEYLGNLCESVDTKKGIMVSELANQGLVPCIDIFITPSPSSKLAQDEWLQHCRKLESEISSRWSGVWPIRVRLVENI